MGLSSTKRRFVCAPKDLEEFHDRVRSYLSNMREPGQSEVDCLRAHVGKRIHKLKSHGLQMDETTLESLKQWNSTYSWDDLHYVLHHIVWQIWDAHNRGVIKLNNELYQRYTQVTSDCIYKS